MSTKIKVLSVCGSGVVTSHMVANKIVDMFADEGYDVDAEECNPSELDGYLMRGSYDFIAYSSPIGDPTAPLHSAPWASSRALARTSSWSRRLLAFTRPASRRKSKERRSTKEGGKTCLKH